MKQWKRNTNKAIQERANTKQSFFLVKTSCCSFSMCHPCCTSHFLNGKLITSKKLVHYYILGKYQNLLIYLYTSHPTWTHFFKGNSDLEEAHVFSIHDLSPVLGASWCRKREGKSNNFLFSFSPRKGTLQVPSVSTCIAKRNESAHPFHHKATDKM